MKASLNKKLQEIKWGKFELGKLFDVDDSWVYGKNKQWNSRYDFNGPGRIPVISGITVNNGISYYTADIPNENEIFKDSLTISTRGEYSGTVTYHEGIFVLANNILVMSMPALSKNQKLFMGSIINNLNYGGYDNYPRVETLKKDIVELPLKNDDIDYDFMDNFVAELEAIRVAELEAYLSTTGLKNYILTEEENAALKKLNLLSWKSYNLENLFGKSTRGKRLKSDDRLPGILPFVTAGEADEGISGYIANNVKIFEANTTTIDMFGSAKYRNYRYGGDDHVAIVHTEKLEKHAAIFVTTAIHKSSHNGQFSYDKNFYAKDADALNIMLPVDSSEPDYKYMSTLIRAIQKIVIKDVVLFSNAKINTTRTLINNK